MSADRAAEVIREAFARWPVINLSRDDGYDLLASTAVEALQDAGLLVAQEPSVEWSAVSFGEDGIPHYWPADDARHAVDLAMKRRSRCIAWRFRFHPGPWLLEFPDDG